MKHIICWLSLLTLMGFVLGAEISPAAAQSPLPTPQAIQITAVEPRSVTAGIGGTVSVYGSGFTAASVVRLVGHGLLSTTFVNEGALMAQVGTNLPAGTYDVEVSDGSSTARRAQALTVRAPAPTPAPPAVAPPPPPGSPVLTLRNYRVEPPIVRPGQEFLVTIEIYNNGSRAGENTMVVFPGTTFVPVGEPGHLLWQLHINHTAVVTQQMRVPAQLASGVHQLQVNLSANDWEGTHYEYTQSVPVEVQDGSSGPAVGQPRVTVEAASTRPAPLIPGAPFTLTLQLANRGSRTATAVFVRSGPEEIAIPAAGSDTVSLPRIGIDEVVTVTLPLVLDPATEGGRQRLPLELSYSDYGGGSYTVQEEIGVDVSAGLAYQPQLLIQRYRTTPAFLSPGDTFTLTLEVANVGGADAHRLTLALGGEGGAALDPFSPLEAGNVRFVERIAAGGAITLSQRLMVDGAAAPKAYNLPVALAYDDPRGSRQVDTQRLSLPVAHRVELQAAFYREPGDFSIQTPAPVSLEIYNIGRGSLDVIQLAASGVGLEVSTEGMPFVGALDPGNSAPLDVTVTPQRSGAAEIVVAVTFRDDFNQIQVLTNTLTIEVAAGPSAGEMPLSPPAPESPRPAFWGQAWRVVRGFLGFGS